MKVLCRSTFLVGVNKINRILGSKRLTHLDSDLLSEQILSREELTVLTNQEIMEKLFPNMKQYPINSMTLTLARGEDGEDKVVFLVLGDENFLQDIVQAPKSVNVNIKVDVRPDKNANGIDTDVIISFKMYYPTGTPNFETAIYGHEREAQQYVCQTLMKAKDLYVFFATDKFKFTRLMEFGWTPSAHPLISKLARGSGGSSD